MGSCWPVQQSIHQSKLINQQGMAGFMARDYLRPMMVPMLHTKGMMAYAFATVCQKMKVDKQKVRYIRSWSGFLTSSPTMVWITPMFPFRMPPRTLPARATQKVEEKPTTRREDMVPQQPISSTWEGQQAISSGAMVVGRTGLRPMRSERPPQNMPVQASAREKAEMRMPAKKGAWVSEAP